MRQIRDWLWIGNSAETSHLWYLKLWHISAMLQLADYIPQSEIETLYLPVEDGVPLPAAKIKKGLEFLLKQKSEGKTILVACGAGVSRSVTFGIAALVEAEKREIFDAYREILLEHNSADPHFELVVSLSAYYGKALGKEEAADKIFAVRRALKR